MGPAPAPTSGTGSSFVVRRPGAWSFAPLPAQDPVAITSDGVLELLAEASVPPPAPLALPVDEARPLDGDDQVGPAWMVVGQVVRGGIVVEARSVGLALLDAVDVRLLAAVDAPARVADLAAIAESELAGRRRLRRLVALGCLQLRSASV